MLNGYPKGRIEQLARGSASPVDPLKDRKICRLQWPLPPPRGRLIGSQGSPKPEKSLVFSLFTFFEKPSTMRLRSFQDICIK